MVANLKVDEQVAPWSPLAARFAFSADGRYLASVGADPEHTDEASSLQSLFGMELSTPRHLRKFLNVTSNL